VCLSAAAAQSAEDVKFYNLEKEYRPTVTFVYKVKNAQALELRQIVKEMLSIYGTLYVNEQANELYITDVPEKVEDVKKALDGLDMAQLKAGNNLVSELAYLRHRNVSEVIDIIRHKLSVEGTLQEVAHLNAFTVTDIPSKIQEVLGLLEKIDVAGPHIAIEITVVEFNDERFSSLGINVFNWLQGLGAQIELYGDDIGSLGEAGTAMVGSRTSPEPQVRDNLRDPEYEMPAGVSARLSVSDLVGFICENADGSVLANTRIVTTNNKDAQIAAKEIIPYRFYENEDAFRSPNEETVSAGIQLRVLPTLQEDSLINLRVVPVISDLTGWSPKGMPIIFERSLSTEVKVRDNSVFVLGGLRRRETVDVRRGIPGLKEIPIIQYLFSVKQTAVVEREVLIFIRPTTQVNTELSAQAVEGLMQRYEKASSGRKSRR
jgi:type II secretory pathway component GspD/PulD (secretin)